LRVGDTIVSHAPAVDIGTPLPQWNALPAHKREQPATLGGLLASTRTIPFVVH
jgi:hypothetical protein